MRIDFVITELFVGGAEKCLTKLAIGLAESGDIVRVFSLASLPDGEQRQLVDRLQSFDIEVESGDADSVWAMAGCYKKLRRWLAQPTPDVCQTFLYHANVLGTLAAKTTDVGICVGGVRVAEAKSARCLIERYAVNQMDSVVCVSGAVRRFAIDRLRSGADDTIVIANGVDVSRFAMAKPFAWSSIGWPDDAVVSLFVGRLHQQKGIESLQRQLDQLAPVDSDRKLLLVGDGPLRAKIESWIEQVGRTRVRLLPWQSDVAPLMTASRLLILPSRYEGMPNVVLEAMAAARPVVCSRVEGSEELLAHALEEQSFPAGDEEAMTRVAERFLSDPSLSETMGMDNQARVKNNFSIPAMIDAYRSHYRTLLARRLDD